MHSENNAIFFRSLVTRCSFIDPYDASLVHYFRIKLKRSQYILDIVWYNCSTTERKESCSTYDMARLYYECNADLRNNTEDSETNKPYACTPDKYCLYCCCNSQCCLLVQRRPPRHFWEAWYFWLGVALLAVFIISSVSDPRWSLILGTFALLKFLEIYYVNETKPKKLYFPYLCLSFHYQSSISCSLRIDVARSFNFLNDRRLLQGIFWFPPFFFFFETRWAVT